MKRTLTAFGLMAVLFSTAEAQDVGIQGDVGTTGIGFHASMPVGDNLNARFGLGYLDYSHKGSTTNMDVKLNLKANTYDALLDWYPSAKSAFRMTTGLAYNGSKIDVQGRPNASGNYMLSGNTYDAGSVGNVTGKVRFNKIAPYLGIGWGRPAAKEKGWSFSTDVGVLLQGSARTSLKSSGCAAPGAMCEQFGRDLARENASLRSEANRFKLYPVLRIGASYTF